MTEVAISPGIFWAVMAGYLVVLGVLGWISFTRTKTIKEFLTMGGAAGAIVIAFAYPATQYSVSTFMGCSGFVYRSGWSIFSIACAMSFGMIIPAFLIGFPLLKIRDRCNFLTLPDYLGDRYYSQFYRGLIAVMIIVFLVPYMGVQIIAGGLIFEVFTGMPFAAGAIATGIIIAIYCGMGGIRGAMWTDLLQGSLMLMAALALAIFGIQAVGGFGALNSWLASNAPGHLTMPGTTATTTYLWHASQVLLWPTFALAQPQLFTKFLAIKNKKELRKAMLLGGIFFFVAAWLIWISAMSATKLLPGLTGKEIDAVIPLLALRLLPFPIASLMVAGLLAAGMSTIDSTIVCTSSAISRDLAQKTFGWKVKEAMVLKLTRAMVVVFAAVAVLFAIWRPALIYDIVMMVFAVFGVIWVPIVLGLHWKRATREGAIWSTIIGGLFTGFLYLAPEAYTAWTAGAVPVLFAVPLTLVLMVVISYLTPEPPGSVIERIFGE